MPRAAASRTRLPRPAKRPSGPAFQSFLDRDALRQQRRRGRRRTLIISVGIHLIAAAVVILLSIWDVEELWGPSVPVTLYKRIPASVPGIAPQAPAPPAPAGP